MSEGGKGMVTLGVVGWGGRPLWVMLSDVHFSPHSAAPPPTPPHPTPATQTNLHSSNREKMEAVQAECVCTTQRCTPPPTHTHLFN